MTDPHTAVGIATTVFYANAVPITHYVALRNWRKGERLTWYFVAIFSLIRLVSGILVIVRGSQPDNIGLVVGTLVLLNIGVIPLVHINDGFINIVLASSFPENTTAKTASKLLHYLTLVAVALVIVSSSLLGDADASSARQAIIKAGYVLLIAVFLGMVAFLFALLRRQSSIIEGDVINIQLALVAAPFVLLRCVYGLLYAFDSADFYGSMWNPLWGNAVASALMALLPEFVALCIYTYLGFRRFLAVRAREAKPGDARVGGEDGEVML